MSCHQAMSSEVLFFSSIDGQFGCLSNFFRCTFYDEAGRRLTSSEQGMMLKKAELFDDKMAADKIVRSTDPQDAKVLGRGVRGFDDDKWRANVRRIVDETLLLKFTQNKEALSTLLSTGDRLLAYASDVDSLWGIGLTADRARVTRRSKWPGANWLGKALCNVRVRLRALGVPGPVVLDVRGQARPMHLSVLARLRRWAPVQRLKLVKGSRARRTSLPV
jgi:ribA/ribD-fused uncharacterized protein